MSTPRFRRNILVLATVVLAATSYLFAADGTVPPLPGTNWQLLSMTKKGEPIKDAMNPADVEFTKKGEWGVLHYGGRREAGTYVVTKNHIVMKMEDGEIYMDAEMTWKPADETLELQEKEYLMRLRKQKPQKK